MTPADEPTPYPAPECWVCGGVARAFLPGRWVAHPDGTRCLLGAGELAPRYAPPDVARLLRSQREVTR